MGFQFGKSESAIPPNLHNSRGFWERQDVMDINDDILRAIGCGWDDLVAFHPDRIGELSCPEIERRIRDVLDELTRQGPAFLKDPRLCLTLPVWCRVQPPAAVVEVVRPPLEVAASLVRRGDASLMGGLALWEGYVRAAGAQRPDVPTFMVRFDQFRRDPVSGAAALAEQLRGAGIPMPGSVTPELIADWFDASLVNFSEDGTHRDSLPPAVARVWEQLLRSGGTPLRAPYDPSAFARDALRYLVEKTRRDEAAVRRLTLERAHYARRMDIVDACVRAFRASRLGRIYFALARLYSRLSGRGQALTPFDQIEAVLDKHRRDLF